MSITWTDVWGSGDAYEPYVGRRSRPVAAGGSLDLVARAWAVRGTRA